MNTNSDCAEINMNKAVAPKIYEIVNDAVNGAIENFEISVQDPDKKGDGFLGEIFFVSLRDKTTGKELKIVVKQAFSEQTVRNLHSIRDIYLKEIHFYTKVWPEFSKFQEGIPKTCRFSNLAKCLATISEENFERLALADLNCEGFVLYDKKKVVKKEMFEVIFKLYGIFHAISFAYKALHPEEFSKLVKGIYDSPQNMFEKKEVVDFHKYIFEQSLESLQPGVDDAVIEKYSHYVDDGVNLYKKSWVNGKYNALIHGDCWSNNMMFKYDDSGTLIDGKFLDFQAVRVGSPVCDLSYCLYSGGTKETFDDLDHFLRIYHDSLSESIRAFGCDPEELYSWEALKDDWKSYCLLGATVAFLVWRRRLIYDDEVVDLVDMATEDGQDLEKYKEAKFDEKTYKERMRDIIVHLYENNYLI